MKISVLLPVFNGAQFLDKAIASIADQLEPRDELLVQDGGSTDDTLAIVESWREQLPQLSVRSETDHGQTDALGRALHRATGDFVGWLNADDIVAPQALREVRMAAQSHPLADLIYGGFRIVDGEGRTRRRLMPAPIDLRRLLRHGCYLFSGSTYFRRTTLIEVGLDTNLHYCMDYDLFLRLAARPDLRAAQVPEVIGAFRYHGASKTGHASFEFVKEAYRIRRRTVASVTNLGPTGLFDCLLAPTTIHVVAAATARIRYSTTYSRLRDKTRTVGQ